MTATMNISLPDALKRYAHERAKDGGYGSPSEYVRNLIREDQQRRAIEDFERQLQADFVRANPAATPEAWDALHDRFEQRLSALQADVTAGLDSLDRGEGRTFDQNLAESIKARGRAT